MASRTSRVVAAGGTKKKAPTACVCRRAPRLPHDPRNSLPGVATFATHSSCGGFRRRRGSGVFSAASLPPAYLAQPLHRAPTEAARRADPGARERAVPCGSEALDLASLLWKLRTLRLRGLLASSTRHLFLATARQPTLEGWFCMDLASDAVKAKLPDGSDNFTSEALGASRIAQREGVREIGDRKKERNQELDARFPPTESQCSTSPSGLRSERGGSSAG